MTRPLSQTLTLTASLVLALCAQAADIAMQTERWANNDDAFAKFAERIENMSNRNLLARRKVRVVETGGLSRSAVQMIADGMAGVRGHDGRIGINGQPSVITVYLGEPKTIKEVGVFTFNIDARANQDFEVRFANNAANPGRKPKFPDQPLLSSGPKVIGPDSGGFHTWFRRSDGSDLVPGQADWVQFRIWRTYNVKAGSSAKDKNTASSWSALIELEVLGDEKDVLVLSPEEVARRKAVRKAPTKPAYEKKATWQQTMVAAHEAVVEWEIVQDRLAIPDSGATFGPWHALGPIDGKSKLVREIERQRKLDLAKSFKADDGKPVAWQRRDDLKDGEMIDAAARFGARPGQVVFLARMVEVEQQFDWRNPYMVSVGLREGFVRLLPMGWTQWPPQPRCDAFPNQCVWKWRINPGKYQILARVTCVAEGRPELWFLPMSNTARPGGGNLRTRVSRRENIFHQLRRDFTDPVAQTQMKWEQLDSIWVKFQRRAMAHVEKFITDWPAGNPDFLNEQYMGRIERRAAKIKAGLEGPRAAEIAARVDKWLERAAERDVAKRRAVYYALATCQEALAAQHQVESMRLAVEDQCRTFADRYANGQHNLERVQALAPRVDAVLGAVLARGGDALGDVLQLRDDIDKTGQEVLLANPLLDFDKLLVLSGGPGLAANWGNANRLGRKIEVLSPVRPDGKLSTIHEGAVSSMELSWDARRILFADGTRIFEVNVDGTGLRQISPDNPEVHCYDPCRLPNGKIVFVSTACEQAVPCTGQPFVGNLYIMDDDGSHVRRLTFDQDHDWNPVVMHDGRVLYTRWEYNDTPHYFSRLLFKMYPDGSGQMEYYGSNSYWPNAMYWPQPIPGKASMIACIVSGHHGVPRMGELMLLDPALGRHEADGVVQRIPGRGKRVEPVIKDGLVGDSWPRFITPWPLAEPETNRGAGKYFLVTAKMDPLAPWGLYLVDVFDNMTPLLMGGYSMPIPLRPRPKPPVVEDRIDLSEDEALVYMTSVYEGKGLRGYPRGSINALRISSVHYRFGGNSDTRAASYEGGWDVKKIIGTVPVHDDGSAIFFVPANTPIVVQPLDVEGKAQQQMRSWFTAMPGEKLSCVGCHEPQNTVTPNMLTQAMRVAPSRIKPWHGPTRGFSFDREVQPVLDRRCAGCHNGQPRKDGKTLPDLRAKRLRPDFKGHYSPAYMAVQPYVRRAGYEADYHLLPPAEFEADTSQLVQMLKKGHHNVQLSREDWDRLYTWIDLNIPYPLNWRESHRPPTDEQVARRVKYKKLYANIDDRDEEPRPLPPVAKFIPPKPLPIKNQKSKIKNPVGWPFDAKQAAERQKQCGLGPLTLDLGGVTMTFVAVPAGELVMGDAKGFADERPQSVVRIEEPFWVGQFEVTNEQYACFDPAHDSGYMEGRFKDRHTRGTPVNAPKQPVVRVTWREAMAFCAWLSKRTGRRCTLPTEAQWEYACRAGTATSFCFGEPKPGLRDVGNFSDESLRRWNCGRVEAGYADGARFSIPGGRYKPNAWGAYDMLGNVAEWCLSAYRPYPYDPSDGRDDASSGPFKVVRGGSWNDAFRFSRSASRWRYRPYQPIYNVGFRVVCLRAKTVAASSRSGRP